MGVDERVKALKYMMDKAPPPSAVLSYLSRRLPSVVSDDEFVSWFSSAITRFNISRLSTEVLNHETVLFLVTLYARPPRLAFVLLRGGCDGLILMPSRGYRLVFDGVSEVLGPRIINLRAGVRRNVLAGNYVPISGTYLVVDEDLGYEPKYRVLGRRSWYVYEVSEASAVVANVVVLLSFLR